MTNYVDRIGVLKTGPHRGCYVTVELDASGAGYHIWVLKESPKKGPSEGWDIWADNEDQLEEWFEDPNFQVDWFAQEE